LVATSSFISYRAMRLMRRRDREATVARAAAPRHMASKEAESRQVVWKNGWPTFTQIGTDKCPSPSRLIPVDSISGPF